MREIRFRAWDKKRKKMFTVHSIYCGDPESCINVEYSTTSFKVKVVSVDCELMQFTGLKDKNGKEIYENDILIDGEDKITCFWCSRHAGFEWKRISDNMGFKYESLSHTEIIGNIYENQELLDSKKGEIK